MDIIMPLDTGITGYYKENQETKEWENIAVAIDHSSIPERTVVTISLTEGGSFDMDDISVTITDPGGPVSSGPAPIPVLTHWGMFALLGILFLAVLPTLRRRRRWPELTGD
jgi:hypothetical protein